MAKNNEVRSSADEEITLLSNEEEAGWYGQFDKIELDPFQSFSYKVNFNLKDDIDKIVNDPDCLYDLVDTIIDETYNGLDTMVEYVRQNASYFKRDRANSQSTDQMLGNIFYGYIDSFFDTMFDYYWFMSDKQLRKEVKLRIQDGLRISLLFSKLHVSYKRMSDGKIIDDYYPIFVAVPSGEPSKVVSVGAKAYQTSPLGGFFDPANRSIVALASSKIGIASSVRHEVTHAVLQSIDDYLKNDMYGADQTDRKEEEFVHYVTDRLNTFVTLNDIVSQLQVQINLSTGMAPYAFNGTAKDSEITQTIDVEVKDVEEQHQKRERLQSLLQSHLGSKSLTANSAELLTKLMVESLGSDTPYGNLSKMIVTSKDNIFFKEITKVWHKNFQKLKTLEE